MTEKMSSSKTNIFIFETFMIADTKLCITQLLYFNIMNYFYCNYLLCGEHFVTQLFTFSANSLYITKSMIA